MKVNSRKLTGGLVCTALLASVSAISSQANADPTDIYAGFAQNLPGGFFGTAVDAWDSGVFGGAPHTYGTQSVAQSYFGTGYSIGMDSTAAPRPGWDWEISLDLSNSGMYIIPTYPQYNQFTVYLYIKEPGVAPITDFHLKYNGQDIQPSLDFGTFGGAVLAFQVNIADMIDPTGFVTGTLTVQWNQVPAPGALALLGVAGLVGKRRRRN